MSQSLLPLPFHVFKGIELALALLGPVLAVTLINWRLTAVARRSRS